MHLPDRPPFALRARILTPLAAGGTADIVDGVIEVDGGGRIAWVGDALEWATIRGGVPGSPGGACTDREDDRVEPVDLRPFVVMPGIVDLHAHLPQLPNAGLGAGMDVLSWLDRYIFPLERRFDQED